MTPRDRRLVTDLRDMESLAARGGVSFRTDNNPPEIYHLMLTGLGLALDDRRTVAVRQVHRCDVYLHLDYPRRPPIVTWLTPVFHPNLLGPERNGGVCIGSWSGAESLADLVVRLHDLVTYRAVNPIDALDLEAAVWVREHAVEPGADITAFAGSPIEQPVVAGGEAR
jgi:ubiquitin-protein ligase